MNGDIVLSLKSYQDIMGDGAFIDTVSDGKYYKKGSRHIVVYYDAADDRKLLSGMIKMTEGQVDIVRKGSENVRMSFVQGSSTSAVYHTDAGDLRINIFTDSVSLSESDDEIRAEVVYSLSMNEVFISNSRVMIGIRSRMETL